MYPINSTTGALGAPVAGNDGNCFPIGTPVIGSQPIGVTATAFVNYLYVADQGTHSVYAYSVNYTNGQLTPLAANNFQAGVKPSAIVSDPTGRFVYVTDQYQNLILGVQHAYRGSAAIPGEWTLPDGSVSLCHGRRSTREISLRDQLQREYRQCLCHPGGYGQSRCSCRDGVYGTGTGPTCIVIEPAYGRYVYTANYARQLRDRIQTESEYRDTGRPC